MATRNIEIIPFLGLLVVFLIFMFFVLLLAFKFRIRIYKKILENRGFYIYNYNESLKKVVIETLKTLFGSSAGGIGYRSRYFPKIEAKTLKNKSLLITQEKIPDYPHYQLVFVMKNPKVHFPSFKLSRNIAEPVSVPKNVEERDVANYYSILTNQRDLVLSKLQTYRMKKHYKKMVREVFELNFDQKLQTMTVLANRFYVGIKEVLDFMLTLDEAIEDYKEETIVLSGEKQKKLVTKQNEKIPNSLKINNIVSLVNTTTIKEKCVICWSRIDYTSETLLFECCSGYTHLDHGVAWVHEKEKCPKCGYPNPFMIQLPILLLEK